MEEYLINTTVIDCDSEIIKEKAGIITEGLTTIKEKATALFYYVRDGIKHTAYAPCTSAEDHKASSTLERGTGQCTHKSALLAALCRSIEIPARVGYVDIQDNLLSHNFRDQIGGTNILPMHGYAELYIDGQWLHVNPAHDLPTCQKRGFVPVDFDGINHAKDPTHNIDGKPHIIHVKDHGIFADLPWEYMDTYRQEWVKSLGKDYAEVADDHETSVINRHK